jgi:CRISPR/Cas system-associated exonuclease Cas4 (RecB family)
MAQKSPPYGSNSSTPRGNCNQGASTFSTATPCVDARYCHWNNPDHGRIEISPWTVEFKHGRKRRALHDDLQLAAQALCLEEMLGRPVPKGAIYHASRRRRREVEIGPALREQVAATADAIRAMLAAERLPRPANDARCPACSLIEICQPALVADYSHRVAELGDLFATDDEP